MKAFTIMVKTQCCAKIGRSLTQMGGLSVDACTHKVNSDMLITNSDCRGLLLC